MKTFEQLDLIKPIQSALASEKYETPTPIQAQTIPAALDGEDILGCAQTGTGKTASFALPILNRLGKNSRKAKANRPAALILAPTRELAIQISDSLDTYGKNLKLRVSLVYGGVSQVNQVRILNRGAHVVVATPGRLLDLINQGHIKLDELEMFVLDEADRMLDMGFLPDIKKIIKMLPEKRQTMFFSATLANNIISLSKQLLRNPVSVNVSPKKPTVDKIKQSVMFIDRRDKINMLEKILKAGDAGRALVFTRTKRMADTLTKQLTRFGIKATAIHGNKTQNARQRALEAFRRNKVEVLVATDVAARGIDIDGVTHVINYDMPVEADSYIHRIGRTGRAGAEGIAISFCTSGERKELKAIERLISMKIPVDPAFAKVEFKKEENSSSRTPSRKKYPRSKPRSSSNKRSGPPVSTGARARTQTMNYSAGESTTSERYEGKQREDIGEVTQEKSRTHRSERNDRSNGSKHQERSEGSQRRERTEGKSEHKTGGSRKKNSSPKRFKKKKTTAGKPGAVGKPSAKKSGAGKNSTRPSTTVSSAAKKPKKKRRKPKQHKQHVQHTGND